MKRITSAWQMVVLNTYWIGLSFKWNALHPIILPAILLNFVPETQKNTYLGGLTFAGLLLAMVVQPVAGVARGISADGALIVDTAVGLRHCSTGSLLLAETP